MEKAREQDGDVESARERYSEKGGELEDMI